MDYIFTGVFTFEMVIKVRDPAAPRGLALPPPPTHTWGLGGVAHYRLRAAPASRGERPALLTRVPAFRTWGWGT